LLNVLAGCASHAPRPLQLPPPPPLRTGEPQPPPPPPIRPSEVSPQQSPAEEPVFSQAGLASIYATRFHGTRTASGDKYDKEGLTAAHRDLAFGTIVRVTNTANGRWVKVQVNDRGPRLKKRVIDLSHAAASALGVRRGLFHVRLEVFRSDQAPD
ncbi:MAG TPA: septal ring lytic transglycosylase RlpA family protein, partial [Rhizomicrobium sp.]|nr:septal ring lytic transglycosylase RlpA family protein [Rhizomicrobium sp.]